MVKMGETLSELHLLSSKKLENPNIKFPIEKKRKIEKVEHNDEKIWINDEQYFTAVSEEIWNYKIGGFRICEKWLKERRGRILSFEESELFKQIILSITLTIKIQNDIDKLYESID